MDNQGNLENLRVASFSAYLNSSEEDFVLKLSKGGIKDNSDNSTSPRETIIMNSGKRKTDHDGEIGIFGADRYFNLKMDQETPKLIDYNKMMNKDDEVAHTKRRSDRASSICSESSSQRALLPKLSKSPSQVKQRKENGRRFFLGFVCRGPCSDKKSVHTDKGVENLVPKQDQMRRESSFRKESFRFPTPLILDRAKENNFTLKKILQEEKSGEEEKPRYSIEVFGSSTNKKKGDQVELNLERKLSMLTWDAIPKNPNSQHQASSIIGSSNGPFDDNQSDASSDLFEIETLSGNGSTFLTNQTTQYAPSEASIEWSVVTASAADFTFSSEFDDKSIINMKNNTGERKEGHKRSGGLLGCKNQKAVSVDETACVSVEGKLQQGRVWRKDFEFAPI